MCLYTDASNRWDVQQNTNTHTHSERETAYTLGSLASILGPFFLLLTWHVRDLAAADPAGGRVKKWAPSYCLTETRRLIEWILRRAENGDFQKRRGRNEHKKEEGRWKAVIPAFWILRVKCEKKIQFWGRRMCKVLLWYSNIELFRFLFNVTIQRSDWLLWNN